jgi:hypothetical protein
MNGKRTMSVLIYASEHGQADERFELDVVRRVPFGIQQRFHTVEDLVQGLRETRGDERLLVCLARSSRELAGLCAVSRFIERVRLILIVPDQERETIAMAHSLYPRFLGFMDNGYAEVGEVLARMAARVSGAGPGPSRKAQDRETPVQAGDTGTGTGQSRDTITPQGR